MKYYQDDLITIYHGDCREVKLEGISAIVTDPPYEIGFMGKEWDKRGISFQKEAWGKLRSYCLPGAMLLSFGGTRTSHRIAVAIEDAGWQIRDMIMWVYGSGFPKSLDISKAIDKRGGKDVGWFGGWLRKWRIENDIKQSEISVLFPSKTGGLTGCVANWELGLNMPTAEQFTAIVKHFNLPFTTIEEAKRVVVGKQDYTAPIELYKIGEKKEGSRTDVNITIASTPEAKLWEGYGTALKPAYEPIILAMNPLDGTFAENCLKWGVGGLNIDQCRVPTDWSDRPESWKRSGFGRKPTTSMFGSGGTGINTSQGRFPTNFIHDGSQEVMELFPQTLGAGNKRGTPKKAGSFFSTEQIQVNDKYDNGGSAARFFYCAKASRRERDAGLEDMPESAGIRSNAPRDNEEDKTKPTRNNHPTVKPLALMEYLCKLVKMPEYNLILDPFCGSGSTLLACKKLGIPCIGIDNDEKSCEIAAKRCQNEAFQRNER